ncbi:hypothetical protein NC653_039557 [Populus alba x Populus x berolinensis]|uniref:Uncharacterized protein n=1 Tax=Populus alba x Populus x berolinensis TaxID=444605 RepID=A0AAD6PS87_9ROSI|nr:hypothetical protein NC653_039557 [Populus alba x Populus x berolinensis]
MHSITIITNLLHFLADIVYMTNCWMCIVLLYFSLYIAILLDNLFMLYFTFQCYYNTSCYGMWNNQL